MGYREGGRGFHDRPPREQHEITCSVCGKKDTVPFKPDGVRPVFCRDCYQKNKPQRNFDKTE